MAKSLSFDDKSRNLAERQGQQDTGSRRKMPGKIRFDRRRLQRVQALNRIKGPH